VISQIPTRCRSATRSRSGRRPVASWNLAYHTLYSPLSASPLHISEIPCLGIPCRAGLRPGRRPTASWNLVYHALSIRASRSATRSQTSCELVGDQVRTCLRPGSSYLDMSRELELVADRFASRSQTSSRTSSRAGSLAGQRNEIWPLIVENNFYTTRACISRPLCPCNALNVERHYSRCAVSTELSSRSFVSK